MYKRLVFTMLLLAISISVSAEMRKGSVGAGGHKGFGFIMDNNGTATVTLIYDSPTADLDLIAAIVDENNNPIIIGLDASTQRNFAQIQFGLVSGNRVVFLVDSYKGASPFRLFVSSAGSETVITVGLTEVDQSMEDRISRKAKEVK